MKRLSSSVLTITFLMTACAGGGGGSTPGEIHSGSYTVSEVTTDSDTCGLGSALTGDLPGEVWDIVVSETKVSFAQAASSLKFDLRRTGNDLASASGTGEFGVEGTDCVVSRSLTFSGTITGDDQLRLTESEDYKHASGDCSALGLTMPCTSTYTRVLAIQ